MVTGVTYSFPMFVVSQVIGYWRQQAIDESIRLYALSPGNV